MKTKEGTGSFELFHVMDTALQKRCVQQSAQEDLARWVGTTELMKTFGTDCFLVLDWCHRAAEVRGKGQSAIVRADHRHGPARIGQGYVSPLD